MTYDDLRKESALIKKKDRIIMDWMILLSILFHVIILYMIIPDFKLKRNWQKQETNFIQMSRYKPPPPPKEEKPKEKKVQKKKKVLAKPIPEPMMNEPNPLDLQQEEDFELVYDATDIEFEDPEPPPDQPLRVGGDVKAPVITNRVQPEYPDIARKARIQGMVILECVITKDGKIADVSVIKSLNSVLDQAAIEAVRKWEFEPGTQNDIPVDVIMNLTVVFQLN